MIKVKNKIRKAANRTYLAKDFEAFRSELLEHARIFFPDKIQDFSEPSVGGLFLDMAAAVGDSLSYYLDHQFRELDPQLAVEPSNIKTHLRNAGVKIFGAAPATVTVKFTFDVNAQLFAGGYRPDLNNLPVVLSGTKVKSLEGVIFSTVDDLDFAERDLIGNLVHQYVVKTVDTNNIPLIYTMTAVVDAVSGEQATETFTIPDTHVPFREISLSNENVSTVISVKDSGGEDYYEVKSLTQDSVFSSLKNDFPDYELVPRMLEIIPAPKRFITKHDPTTRLTTLQFGSGDAETLDNDIIPDPSDLALPLYGKTNFSRFTIDPNSLLQTHTLGIAPRGTTLTIMYRYGGGLAHNVASDSINELEDLILEFRQTVNPGGALRVRQTMAVNNDSPAAGGSAPPTLSDLQQLIPAARLSQDRVVTKEDLLARLYTMPAQFGRIYRAAVGRNPINPLSSILFLVSLDRSGALVAAPDSLKKNISTYLNEFRLISDAVDILDTRVINFGIRYTVIVAQNVNKIQILKQINNALAAALRRKYFQINQPLVVDDITNIIINTDFVVSLTRLQIFPRAGTVEDREYSSFTLPIEDNTKNGMIFGPDGSIFEMKFPSDDIIGSAL